jgi:hypothetical protein
MTDANLKNSRKKDKAAAFLALHADERKERGPCLSPGEMAALVDNTCAREQRAIFMDHLSSCETCYGEWLTLKKMDDRQTGRGDKRDHLYRFSKKQQYGFIGSALALAASVVVYLNILPLPDTFLDSSSEKPVLVQPDSGPAVPQLSMEKEEKKNKVESENTVPMASQTTEAQPTESMESSADIEDKKIHGRSVVPPHAGAREQQKMPEKAAPSPKRLQNVQKLQTLKALPELPGAATKLVRPESTGAGGMLVDVDSWLAQVEENCRTANQDIQFWTKMHERGKTMLAQQAGLLPQDKEEKVSAALLLLGKMGPAAVTDQCRLLLDLLAEDEKNSDKEPAP